MARQIKFSIIIPFKEPTSYLYECLENIKKQTYKNYEVILLPDGKEILNYPKVSIIPTSKIGPAEKRDVGAQNSKGEILAFIDGDAYPAFDWLKNALHYFSNPDISAVGGPGVTPPGVSFFEEASGWVAASPIGSGGFSYRFIPNGARSVDDYPSMNLLVKRKDFLAVGGFDSSFWPGEDTKLCHDLVYILKKKIIYDPDVLVYHHRRPLWIPHLRQNGNFGLHRGYFAKTLPKTSFRLVYFIPSFLLIGLFLWPVVVIPAYFGLLVINSLWVTTKSRSFFQGVISIPAICATHLWYGIRFIQGFFFTKQLYR